MGGAAAAQEAHDNNSTSLGTNVIIMRGDVFDVVVANEDDVLAGIAQRVCIGRTMVVVVVRRCEAHQRNMWRFLARPLLGPIRTIQNFDTLG